MALKIEVRRTPSGGAVRGGRRRSQWRTGGMSRMTGRIGSGTRMARESTSYRVNGARQWSAPQVERAAIYVDERLAPWIISFLSSAASRIEPSRPSHRSRNTALVTLGIIGLIGALGAALTRRSTTLSRTEETMEQPATAPTPMQSRPFSEGRLHAT